MLRLCLSKFKSQKLLLNDNIKKIIINNILNHGESNCAGENKIKSFVDENNIVSSRHMGIDIFDGFYLHEFIWRNVDKWWDKTAVICSVTGKSYTYGQLKRLSSRLAASLRKMNLGPGDTIAVVLPNMPEYLIIFLATSQAGLKLTLINPVYTAREINKQLENSETAAVITVTSTYPVVAESIKGVQSIRHPVIIIQDAQSPPPISSAGLVKFEQLIADGLPEFDKIGENTGLNPANDTVLLPYSSGTTGLPKGVELTHRNLVANLAQLNHKDYCLTQEAIGDYQDVTPLLLPMYHIYGFSTVVCDYLSHGGKLIIMPKFSSNGFLDVLNKNRVTHMFVAPPVLQLLANDERFTKKHFEGVKQIMSGGAPASEEVMTKIQTRLGNTLKFNQGYGMSEASPLIAIGKNNSFGSVGKVVPNTRVRIVGQSDDGLGKNLPIGEIGEIQVSGPQVMKGYFNNHQATMDTMDGEWLKSGDLGSFDNDGNLKITGRLKELIKVKGMQVSPAELEDLIHGHEKVADVAVVGVPHERFGEIPKAFVVAKKDTPIIKEDEIKEFVAKRVVDYKRLGQVVFVQEIPKNAAGKILRRELQKI